MPKGGYKLIDLHSVSITNQPVQIHGVYDAIESAYGKAIMFSNVVIYGAESPNLWINVRPVSNNYVGIPLVSTAGTANVKFFVTQDDMVSLVGITTEDPPVVAGQPVEEDGPSASM